MDLQFLMLYPLVPPSMYLLNLSHSVLTSAMQKKKTTTISCMSEPIKSRAQFEEKASRPDGKLLQINN